MATTREVAWSTPGCPDACPIHSAVTGMRTQVGRAWDEQQAITRVVSLEPVRAQGAALRAFLGQVLDDLAGLEPIVPDRPEALALAWRYYQRLEEHARRAEAPVAALAVALAPHPGLRPAVCHLQQATIRLRRHVAGVRAALAALPGDQPLAEHSEPLGRTEERPRRPAN